MEQADVDSGLLESINQMTVEELVALQAEVEATGAAAQLRMMMGCVKRLGEA